MQLLTKGEENGSPVSAIIVQKCKLAVPRDWTDVPIEYPLSKSGEKEIIKVELENATEETTYCYRIRMKNEAGLSEPSPECELNSKEMIPDHPCRFHAPKEMITSNNVTLVWDEPVNNPKSVHYYRIDTRQRETDNWVSLPGVKSKSFTVEKLSPNTTFHFRAIAYNKSNRGYNIKKSPSITVTTQSHPPTKPDTSSMDITVKSSTEATVTLQKPNSIGTSGNLTCLIIEMLNEQSISYKKCSYPISVADNDTITQMFDLDNEIKFIRVTLKDEIGTGEPSDVIGINLSSIPPGAPQNLTVKGENCVVVKWTPPALQSRVVTNYCIQIKQSSHMGKEISGEWTAVKEYTYSEREHIYSAEVYHLAPSSEYLFRVNAINGDKAGDYTEIVKCTTPALPPEKPQSPMLILVDHPDKIKVEVKKLEEEKENGSPVTKVIIEYSCDKQNWNVCEEIDFVSLKLCGEENNPQWIIQTRIPNITEKSVNEIAYRVIMKNDAGKSDPSDYSILDVRDLIPGPVICLRSILTTHHEIMLEWEEPAINPAIVTNYQVIQISPDHNQIMNNIDKCQRSYEARGLRPNSMYQFQIKALSSKSSGRIETIDIETHEFDPCPPANLRVHKVKKDAIKICWDDHDGDAETNHMYKITVKPEIGRPITLTKHGRGHTKLIPFLEPSKEYTIHVVGVNKSQKESQPATIKVTTKMSTGKRALFTAMGSIAGGIPGIIAYKFTKGDAEEDFYSSDDD